MEERGKHRDRKGAGGGKVGDRETFLISGHHESGLQTPAIDDGVL